MRIVQMMGAATAAIALLAFGPSVQAASETPRPLVAAGQPVTWWAAFKFNAANFPSASTGPCPFGGSAQAYKAGFSQKYVYASNLHSTLQDGAGSIGVGDADPLGATFGQIYNGKPYFVVWNDQFYDAPKIAGCTKSCSAPWGHSKGIVAWDDQGNGVVLQVTTPSWPASGSAAAPREGDGNTLGCIEDDDVLVSQHFFALALNHADLVQVLKALGNSSVVTNPGLPQLAHNGGPADVQALVSGLGVKSSSVAMTKAKLSSGVQLISKPSNLSAPPWQLVSFELGSIPLRAATWWASPKIPSTTASTTIGCWPKAFKQPGAVAIATTGAWNGATLGLTGGLGKNYNHAKIGIATAGGHSYVIFGDMNQQGALSGKCGSSQNGRGGMFFVVDDTGLSKSVAGLIAGGTAPTAP
jgi:hypothetical protein